MAILRRRRSKLDAASLRTARDGVIAQRRGNRISLSIGAVSILLAVVGILLTNRSSGSVGSSAKSQATARVETAKPAEQDVTATSTPPPATVAPTPQSVTPTSTSEVAPAEPVPISVETILAGRSEDGKRLVLRAGLLNANDHPVFVETIAVAHFWEQTEVLCAGPRYVIELKEVAQLRTDPGLGNGLSADFSYSDYETSTAFDAQGYYHVVSCSSTTSILEVPVQIGLDAGSAVSVELSFPATFSITDWEQLGGIPQPLSDSEGWTSFTYSDEAASVVIFAKSADGLCDYEYTEWSPGAPFDEGRICDDLGAIIDFFDQESNCRAEWVFRYRGAVPSDLAEERDQFIAAFVVSGAAEAMLPAREKARQGCVRVQPMVEQAMSALAVTNVLNPNALDEARTWVDEILNGPSDLTAKYISDSWLALNSRTELALGNCTDNESPLIHFPYRVVLHLPDGPPSVRAGPGGDSEIVGELAPGVGQLYFFKCERTADGSVWWGVDDLWAVASSFEPQP